MTTKRVLVCTILIALGACAGPQTTVREESPAQAAINKAIHSLKQKDMNRCFTPEIRTASGGNKIFIYDVVRQSGPKKQCSLFFADNGRGGFDPALRASFQEGMDTDACDLKALSCVRPAEAGRIAARYGLTIDPAPFAR